MCQVVFNLLHLFLHARDHFVGLVFAELQDALHFNLHQSEYVVACHLADELRFERFQSAVDMCHRCIHVLGILEPLILIDALFNENLL